MHYPTRLLLGGIYLVMVVYIAWPLIPGQDEDVHVALQVLGLIFPLLCLYGLAALKPKPLLYVLMTLNALLACVSFVGLIVQAFTAGFTPGSAHQLPALVFFVVMSPAIAAYCFRSAAASR
jgi:hypothetical protein